MWPASSVLCLFFFSFHLTLFIAYAVHVVLYFIFYFPENCSQKIVIHLLMSLLSKYNNFHVYKTLENKNLFQILG